MNDNLKNKLIGLANQRDDFLDPIGEIKDQSELTAILLVRATKSARITLAKEIVSELWPDDFKI